MTTDKREIIFDAEALVARVEALAADTNGPHSCSDSCRRPGCVKRRTREAALNIISRYYNAATLKDGQHEVALVLRAIREEIERL